MSYPIFSSYKWLLDKTRSVSGNAAIIHRWLVVENPNQMAMGFITNKFVYLGVKYLV